MPPKASKIQELKKKKTATRTSPTSAPSSDQHDQHAQNGTKSEERVDHDGTKSSPNHLNRISPNRRQSQAQAQQRRGAHDRHESCPKKVMVTRLDSVPLCCCCCFFFRAETSIPITRNPLDKE